MENYINEEADFFKKFLRQEVAKTGGTITVWNLFNISTLNILWRIVAGERYDYRDPKLKELMAMVSDVSLTIGSANVFPLVRTIFSSADIFRENVKKILAIKKFLLAKISGHEETFDPFQHKKFH